MKASNRRKTISRSDLESFLCDIEDDNTTKKAAPVDENENARCNKEVKVITATEVVVEETMDIAHAVRLFCRVSFVLSMRLVCYGLIEYYRIKAN